MSRILRKYPVHTCSNPSLQWHGYITGNYILAGVFNDEKRTEVSIRVHLRNNLRDLTGPISRNVWYWVKKSPIEDQFEVMTLG